MCIEKSITLKAARCAKYQEFSRNFVVNVLKCYGIPQKWPILMTLLKTKSHYWPFLLHKKGHSRTALLKSESPVKVSFKLH